MKITYRFAIAALMAASLGLSAAHAAFINEIRIDDASTDTDEYFEISGTPGESLDGLTYIVIGDGSSGGSGVVETNFISLDGQVIPSDGFFLAANSTLGTDVPTGDPGEIDLILSTNFFENSDNVTHLLVSGFTGAGGDDLDTDDDGTLDVFPWTSIIDGVGIVETDPVSGSGNELNYGASLGLDEVGPDGTFVPGHIYRLPNSTGGWNIGAFVSESDTPGYSNVVIPEPATFGLALLSLAGLLIRRK